MKANKRLKNISWQNPIATNLLHKYNYEKSILEIIEIESEKLIDRLKLENHSLFKEGDSTPIEEILLYFYDARTSYSKHTAFSGALKNVSNHLEISLPSSGVTYYRKRFSLAHELGHFVLRQLVSPLTYEEMLSEQSSHDEEETLCNLFASAILMPRRSLAPFLCKNRNITPKLVDNITKIFRVSRETVLRRISWLTNSILIFWNETINPRDVESPNTVRIVRVHPNYGHLSQHFIPLYCTATKGRFTPNIILESFLSEQSISRNISIKDLGSLPHGTYKAHNLFFKKWTNNVLVNQVIEQRKNFLTMATLIELEAE